MYKNKKVSVVISTYREKDSIKEFIKSCFNTGLVDEVIVVNNNAEIGTNEEVEKSNAQLINETKQGYGFGYRKGLENASGDLIIMTEADGTFVADDFEKLLIYSNDYDVVFCTRTATHAILEGANMGLFLKWGNWAVAKLIEVLYSSTQISDVGCTMRLISKERLKSLLPTFKVGASHFGLEMMITVIKRGIPFVEIPIKYQSRIGVSAVTGSFNKTLILGFTMIFYIFARKLKD